MTSTPIPLDTLRQWCEMEAAYHMWIFNAAAQAYVDKMVRQLRTNPDVNSTGVPRMIADFILVSAVAYGNTCDMVLSLAKQLDAEQQASKG